MITRGAKNDDLWEMLAAKEPMWASCTMGRRRSNWQREEFFATGESEVSWAARVASKRGIFPSRRSLVVDFGCGPGRFIGPLSELFQQVIGVDTSKTMRSLTKQAYPADNVTVTHSTASIEAESVDLIYSTFVLQHLGLDGLNQSLREFVRILHPDGLLIFQYPARPRWTLPGIAFFLMPTALLVAIQRYIMRYPGTMPMSWMSSGKVAQRAQRCGLVIVEHMVGPMYSPNWKDIWYLAKKKSDDLRVASLPRPEDEDQESID